MDNLSNRHVRRGGVLGELPAPLSERYLPPRATAQRFGAKIWCCAAFPGQVRNGSGRNSGVAQSLTLEVRNESGSQAVVRGLQGCFRMALESVRGRLRSHWLWKKVSLGSIGDIRELCVGQIIHFGHVAL